MSANKRVELFNAAKASDVEKLLDIVGKKKSDQSELTDAITGFSKSQRDEFWQNIYSICTSTLLKDQDEDQSEEVDENIHNILKCVSSLALSTLTALQMSKSADDDDSNAAINVPQALQEVTIVLHGILPTLSDNWQPLKNQICRLLENWWNQLLDGKEELIANTLTYLLTRCTEPNSSQADVTRIWAVHSMLELVDFKSDTGNTLIPLLQQCCHHPQFISNAQGTKFLAFILTLDPKLMENLHQAIKNHLPATPRSWHPKYGEIYLRAWQRASDGMRQNIEEGCIQDLMYRCVHGCRRGGHSLSPVLLRLLSHLHKQKTQRGVENLLARLYEPILWRSLRVTNSDVRLNAASLMFDVFPLQDPTLLNEQADSALQRQFDIMHSLMTDPVPEVRIRAILGVGNVLNLYWELIPPQVIQCFVTTLIQDLVHDATSPTVREAVIKVMFILCDNHLCITLLKKILPELRDFVHDTSEKVRIAMFELLLKVKGLRAIKFWNIVPVEHILARLEIDSPPITRRIMKLISSSFVPINQPPSQQVERCLTLITSNRNAARQFFLNLPAGLGPIDTSKYILVLCRYALESARHLVKSQEMRLQTEDKNKDEDSDDATAVKKSKVKKSSSKQKGYKSDGMDKDDNEDSENADTVDGVIETDSDSHESVTEKTGSDDSLALANGDFLSDVELLSGLMEAVYLMFTVISPQLSSPEHAALKEGLSKKLSITVRELLNMSQNDHLDNALIALAGHLPNRALPMVSQKLIKRLKQCNHDEDQRTLAIKSLIQWGRADDLIEMAQEVLQAEFQEKDTNKTAEKEKKNKQKAVAFVTEESKLTFDQAANIVVTMLSLAECRLILKKKHRESLRSLVDSLKCVFKFLKTHLSPDDDAQPSNWDCAMKTFSVYLRVSAFLVMSSTDDTEIDSRYIKCATALALELAIPCLLSTNSEGKTKLASQVIEKVIKVSSGLMMVGTYTPEFLNQSVEMCNSVLKIKQSIPQSLTQSALSLVYQFTQLRSSSGSHEQSGDEVGILPSVKKEEVALTCLTEALKSISLLEDSEKKSNCSSSDSCSIVSEIIQTLTTLTTDPDVRGKTLTVTVESFINHLKSCSKQEIIGNDGDKLPTFITSVISTVKRKATNRSSFIEGLNSHLNSDFADIYSIHGIASIVPNLKMKDQKDQSDLNLERAVKAALSQVTDSHMDEDIFRDLKLEVEKKIKSWTADESQPSAQD